MTIESLVELFETKFDILFQKLTFLEKKCETIENIMKKNHSKQTNSFESGISGSQDKIEYLNINCKPIINCSVLTFVHNKLSNESVQSMMRDDIIQILKGSRTLYEISKKYIYTMAKEINTDNFETLYWIYAFPSQKYVLYYWNHDKLSWDKMNKDMLNKLFNLIQQHILNQYSIIISHKNNPILNGIDLVETGSKLYVDDFEKKYTDFKKMIYQSLIS